MTLATRIHKISLFTLYREENNKLHSKFTLTRDNLQWTTTHRRTQYTYIMCRYL